MDERMDAENCCENDASIDVDFLIEYDER